MDKRTLRRDFPTRANLENENVYTKNHFLCQQVSVFSLLLLETFVFKSELPALPLLPSEPTQIA